MAAAHIQNLKMGIDALNPGASTEAWRARYRRVPQGLRGTKAWQKELKDLIRQEKKHEKAVNRAFRNLAKRSTRKTFTAAV